MDRTLNPNIEKQTIYEIFRACRLCGAGSGYKMPIIQNVVDLEDADIQLRQKIKECVQIEVHPEDKMPPLICEICIDRINDFYDFLRLCRKTNKRTRLRLGLPLKKATSESDNCILGVTEPVYHESDDDTPLSKKSRPVAKKKPETKKTKRDPTPPPPRREFRNSSKRQRSPTPPRRTTRQSNEEDSLLKIQTEKKKVKIVEPLKVEKSVPKKQPIEKVASPKTASPKTLRKPVVKEIEKPSKKPVEKAIKPAPAKKTKIPVKEPKEPTIPCSVCNFKLVNRQALHSHMKVHSVTFTNPKLACNACYEWFSTNDEAASHHKKHKYKPYKCSLCENTFKSYSAFNDHFDDVPCMKWVENPDLKCDECWRLFPTWNLRDEHKCLGEDGRPGGKCRKCNRAYSLLKYLEEHESKCTYRKKGELIIDPEVSKKIRPVQIQIVKCDDLLKNCVSGHYDVSRVKKDYGLVKNCYYPYLYSTVRVKTELYGGMVQIGDDLIDFVHWDSESGSDDDDDDLEDKTKAKHPKSLKTLALKVVFSEKLVGKVPRKVRKKPLIADEPDGFDNDGDANMKDDIDNIINNLNTWDDDDDIITKKQGDEDDRTSDDIFSSLLSSKNYEHHDKEIDSTHKDDFSEDKGKNVDSNTSSEINRNNNESSESNGQLQNHNSKETDSEQNTKSDAFSTAEEKSDNSNLKENIDSDEKLKDSITNDVSREDKVKGSVSENGSFDEITEESNNEKENNDDFAQKPNHDDSKSEESVKYFSANSADSNESQLKQSHSVESILHKDNQNDESEEIAITNNSDEKISTNDNDISNCNGKHEEKTKDKGDYDQIDSPDDFNKDDNSKVFEECESVSEISSENVR